MDHPLERQVPTNPDDRIKEFARDLAWGVKFDQWQNLFPVFYMQGISSEESWLPPSQVFSPDLTIQRVDFAVLLRNKWDNKPPKSDHLISQGFLEWKDRDPTSPLHVTPIQRVASVTEKGFALLEPDPVPMRKVFISYRHTESAALAAFLEAGLQNSDLNVDVFTDEKIRLGELWERRLERAVRDCDVFICLFGNTTLCSTNVKNEINWALASRSHIIAVWHNGYNGDAFPEKLLKRQREKVYAENTEMYKYTLNKLVKTLSEPLPDFEEVNSQMFISYRASESATFASLIEARLKLTDPNVEVFMGKMFAAGDDWEQQIEQAVRSCDTFVCLLGPSTTSSIMVQKEIAWALQTGKRVFPMLHNGYRGESNYPPELNNIQWIQVDKESPDDYEIAILKLLHALGYPTILPAWGLA